MRKPTTEDLEQWFTVLLFLLIANLAISNLVDRFKNPQLTETELFLRIPQSFIWNFDTP
jgi:hypothetical protein